MEDRIIGASALAKILEVDRSTVYRLCDQGMPHIQMNDGRVFSRSELKEWFKEKGSVLMFRL